MSVTSNDTNATREEDRGEGWKLEGRGGQGGKEGPTKSGKRSAGGAAYAGSANPSARGEEVEEGEICDDEGDATKSRNTMQTPVAAGGGRQRPGPVAGPQASSAVQHADRARAVTCAGPTSSRTVSTGPRGNRVEAGAQGHDIKTPTGPRAHAIGVPNATPTLVRAEDTGALPAGERVHSTGPHTDTVPMNTCRACSVAPGVPAVVTVPRVGTVPPSVRRERPPPGTPTAPRNMRNPSAGSSFPSVPQLPAKRPLSPAEGIEGPAKRVKKQQGPRAEFVELDAAAQARIENDSLKMKVQEQKREIDDLKERLVSKARDLHVLRTRGKFPPEDPVHSNITFHKCWKKEFGTSFTADEYSDLSGEESEDPMHRNPREPFPDRNDSAVEQGDEGDESVPQSAVESDAARMKNNKPESLDDALEKLGHRVAPAQLSRCAFDLMWYFIDSERVRAGDARETWELPMPLGRTGHPFFKGWLWEDFDARRLFDKTRADYINSKSAEYCRLAREAATLPFCGRSLTQRLVVSVALRHGLDLGQRLREPDVMGDCRWCPHKVPAAIRRQFSYSRHLKKCFSEFDIMDLDNYLTLKLVGTELSSHDERRSWTILLSNAFCWFQQKGAVLQSPDWQQVLDTWLSRPWMGRYSAGPVPWCQPIAGKNLDDDAMFMEVWAHLVNCGIATARLWGDGDLAQYMERAHRSHQEVVDLQESFRSVKPRATQDEIRDHVVHKQTWTRIPDERHLRLRIALNEDSVKMLSSMVGNLSSDITWRPLSVGKAPM